MYHPAVVKQKPMVDSIYLRTPNSAEIVDSSLGGKGLYAQGGGLYAQGRMAGRGVGRDFYNVGKTLGSVFSLGMGMHPAMSSQSEFVRHPNAQQQVNVLARTTGSGMCMCEKGMCGSGMCGGRMINPFTEGYRIGHDIIAPKLFGRGMKKPKAPKHSKMSKHSKIPIK